MKKLHKDHEYVSEWVAGKGYRCATCGEDLGYQPNFSRNGILTIPEIGIDGPVVMLISNGPESGEVHRNLTQEQLDILVANGQEPATAWNGWAYFVNVQDAQRDLGFVPTHQERLTLHLDRRSYP